VGNLNLYMYCVTCDNYCNTPNIPLLSKTTPDLLLNLGGDGDLDDHTTATLPPVTVPSID